LDPVLDPVLNPVLDPVLDPVLNPVLDPVLNPVLDQPFSKRLRLRLKANMLPFQNELQERKSPPIYIIQGKCTSMRRNYDLLEIILEHETQYDYKIKVVGKGSIPAKFNKYISTGKIICKSNLPFEDYHKEFLDAYCIIPLLLKKTHPQYYTDKLTSTINYGEAYRLSFLIDKDLQEIYQLPSKDCFTFQDEKDVGVALEASLRAFYNPA
jgi:hypothetical protein